MGNLYHGSSETNLKILKPYKSTHGSYVYATPYKELAIIFSGRCGDDFTFSLFRNNKREPWNLVERIPEGFNTMFSNNSSIYTVDDTSFKDIHTGFSELVSQVEVKVKKEEKLNKVYDKLKELDKNNQKKIYKYPNKPKSIPSDNSDLIEKQIMYQQISNKDVTKQCFERLVLLHPELLDKINQKLKEINPNSEIFKKEDLITLFEKAIINQKNNPDKEQYLKSIYISVANIYPELISKFKEKLP